MPKIRPFTSTVAPQSPTLPRRSLDSAVQPYQGLADFGRASQAAGVDLTGMADKEAELRRGRQVLDATTNATLDAQDFYQKQLATPQDQLDAHVGLAGGVANGLKAIGDSYRKDLKDPAARLAFDQHFDNLTVHTILDARDEERKREISSSRAVVDNTLGALANYTANSSGAQMDSGLAMAKGTVDWAVNTNLITAEEGGKVFDNWKHGVYKGKAEQAVQSDPFRTAVEVSQGKWPDLTPTEQQTIINDAGAVIKRNQADAEKKLKDAQEASISNMSSMAKNGTLTHAYLESERTRLDIPGSSYDTLFDLIGKRQSEAASDSQKYTSLKLGASHQPPIVSEADIYHANLDFQAGRPGLNAQDTVDLLEERRKNAKAADSADSPISKQRSNAQQILGLRLGSDPVTHARALTELTQSPSFTSGLGDPVASANAIADKYQGPIDKLGGVSHSVAQSNYKLYKDKYFAAINQQAKWASGIRGAIASSFETNPNDEQVSQRKVEFVNAADAAGKVIGPAPPRSIEGAIKTLPSGRSLIILGGKMIDLGGGETTGTQATPAKPAEPAMPTGMVQMGNIDVNHRQVINNADGSHSTIFSATIPLDAQGNVLDETKTKYEDAAQYALVPQIVNGKFLTPDGKMPDLNSEEAMKAIEKAAAAHYQKTKQHLGIFKSDAAASAFAEATHAYMPSGGAEKVFLPHATK